MARLLGALTRSRLLYFIAGFEVHNKKERSLVPSTCAKFCLAQVLRHRTLGIAAGVYWRFGGQYRLHLHSITSTLKMEAVCSCETFLSACKSTRHYNPGDQRRHLHHGENLKSRTVTYFFQVVSCIDLQ
jgi:hypothetical protein